MTKTKKAKVLLVDDHTEMRHSLRTMLEFEKDLEVCGEAGSVAEALAVVEKTKADVAIIDLRLGQGTGLDLIEALNRRPIKIPALVLSLHPESLYAESALLRGAKGYIMKSESPDHILQALRDVLHGKTYLSSAMKTQLKGYAAP